MIFDIIEYLGKYETGVITLLSLNYMDEYYDATFFYTDKFVTVTVDEELEAIIGPIEQWEGYNQLVIDVMSRVVPYDEIIGRIDDIDINEIED